MRGRTIAIAACGAALLASVVHGQQGPPSSLGASHAQLAERARAAPPAEAVDLWLDLSLAFESDGDLAAALAAVDEGLARCTNSPRARVPAPKVANLQQQRGLVLGGLGRVGEAIAELQSALLVFEAGAEPAVTAGCRVNLAAAWSAATELALARSELQRAVADMRASADANLPLALANLSDIERRLGHHPAAVELAREALAAVSAAQPLNPVAVEIARADLARAIYQQGRASKDEALCRRAETLLQAALAYIDDGALLAAADADRQRILQNLAVCCWHRGDLAAALRCSEECVAHAAGTDAESIKVIFGHGSLLASAGRIEEARSFMFRAVARYAALLEAACTAASDRAVAAMHLELRALLSSALSCRDFAQDRPDWDAQDAAAWLVGRGFSEWRNRRARQAVALAATDAAFGQQWQALAGLREAAQREEAGTAAAVQRRNDVDRAEAAVSLRLGVAPACQLEAAKAFPQLAKDEVAVVTATYLRAAAARQGVPTPHGEEHVAAFLLRPGGSARRFELGTAVAVAAAVDAARQQAQFGTDPTRGRTPGAAAPAAAAVTIEDMLRPLLAAFGPEVRRFVVCPDGALASLPWAALREGARCLADRVDVTYVDHPASLRAAGSVHAAPSLLVLGDADFDAAASPAASPPASVRQWDALSGTAREADLCVRLFRAAFADAAATDLRRGDANWANVERGVRGARFLHLATHGFVADEASWPRASDPMSPAGAVVDHDPLQRTGLVLAGANAGARDGVVTAGRLMGLDLSACELAVLACCDSNVGPRAFGDAVSGLHAAVRAAGARSVISTLWQIPDDDSVRFFELFYSALFRDGLPASAAFRHAQREARAAGLPPRCWAAFVYYGPLE